MQPFHQCGGLKSHGAANAAKLFPGAVSLDSAELAVAQSYGVWRAEISGRLFSFPTRTHQGTDYEKIVHSGCVSEVKMTQENNRLAPAPIIIQLNTFEIRRPERKIVHDQLKIPV